MSVTRTITTPPPQRQRARPFLSVSLAVICWCASQTCIAQTPDPQTNPSSARGAATDAAPATDTVADHPRPTGVKQDPTAPDVASDRALPLIRIKHVDARVFVSKPHLGPYWTVGQTLAEVRAALKARRCTGTPVIIYPRQVPDALVPDGGGVAGRRTPCLAACFIDRLLVLPMPYRTRRQPAGDVAYMTIQAGPGDVRRQRESLLNRIKARGWIVTGPVFEIPPTRDAASHTEPLTTELQVPVRLPSGAKPEALLGQADRPIRSDPPKALPVRQSAGRTPPPGDGTADGDVPRDLNSQELRRRIIARIDDALADDLADGSAPESGSPATATAEPSAQPVPTAPTASTPLATAEPAPPEAVITKPAPTSPPAPGAPTAPPSTATQASRAPVSPRIREWVNQSDHRRLAQALLRRAEAMPDDARAPWLRRVVRGLDALRRALPEDMANDIKLVDRTARVLRQTAAERGIDLPREGDNAAADRRDRRKSRVPAVGDARSLKSLDRLLLQATLRTRTPAALHRGLIEVLSALTAPPPPDPSD